MPEEKVKTIEIDEVLPGDKGEAPKRAHRREQEPEPSPFPDLGATLGWKAKITLLLTQGFLYLQSKSWGKWVIGPVVIILVLIAIPVAFLGIFVLMIASLLKKR